MVLRALEHRVLPATEAGADDLWLADLILLVYEIGGIEWPLEGKPLGLVAGCCALPAPAENKPTARAETFEQDVAESPVRSELRGPRFELEVSR